jgi:hypothetical protein
VPWRLQPRLQQLTCLRRSSPAAVRGKAQRWSKEWQLSAADTRQLYLSLASAMRVRLGARGRAMQAACGKRLCSGVRTLARRLALHALWATLRVKRLRTDRNGVLERALRGAEDDHNANILIYIA